MKKLLIFILVLIPFISNAQTNEVFSVRASAGMLSFEECMNLRLENRSEEAVPSLLKLKEQYENDSPFNEKYYYRVVFSLHDYYISTGDYRSSHKLLNYAIGIYNTRSSIPNSEYTRALWLCCGQLYGMLKDYDQALSYLHEALIMFDDVNDKGESYMVALMNIAMAYEAKQDFLSAKLYMDEAIDVFETIHGNLFDITDEEIFIIVSNYGMIFYRVKNYDMAEKCFLYVIDNCKRTEMSHDAYFLACNNLASMYMQQGRYREGITLLEGIQSLNRDRNYQYFQNLAIGYFYLKEYDKAIHYLNELNQCSFESVGTIFNYFSRTERENYWSQLSWERISINNLIAYHSNLPTALTIAYDNLLLCKNLLYNTYRIAEHYVRSRERSYYEDLVNLQQQLAYKSNTPQQRDSLYIKLREKERILYSSIPNFSTLLREKSTTWKDVRTSLDNDEIAIEYCDVLADDLQHCYGAFVIRKDFDYPILVSLEEVDSVEDLCNGVESDPLKINEFYLSNKSVTLYNMLWSKLMPYMDGVKKVYYSPTGYLANINFDVLRDENGLMLNERFAMHRVSSTANILDIKTSDTVSYHSSFLYGNIKYDETEEEMASASTSYQTFAGIVIDDKLALRSESERGKWGPIPYTKTEIDIVDSLLSIQNIEVNVYEGNLANEESFKALSGNSPDILHLATHGFVIDTPLKAEGNKFVASTNIYSQKESYMMWAGLMLAGGNNIWQGKFNLTNVEDGVLTADEISRLDLSNTKLVVLSACETARGKVDPIDGVYGLQRAFKMAGVQTIVMSLWKVGDESTAMLMTRFYTYLTSGIEKHQALWKAMMDVREKYKDPYYWAGFIMLD